MIKYASATGSLFVVSRPYQWRSFGLGVSRGYAFKSHRNILFRPFCPTPDLRSFHIPATSASPFDETIYAVSTATGRAAIAVIRISGPHCLKVFLPSFTQTILISYQIYECLCPSKPLPKHRKATIRALHDPINSENIVDSAALVLYFPTPRTVTGEDVLELHIHGGPATQRAVLSAISSVAITDNVPIRYAEPGEFTRRAFQNDKLDLAQVEALSDALSAETEHQRRAAIRGNSGRLGKVYEGWRQQLLYARGELEALIDFSEDQHFDESPTQLLQSVTQQVNQMMWDIQRHQTASHSGELLKKGIRISLLGPPNAGKSSLLNLMVGREASIVSQEAGTTRDIVEVSLDIQGYLCTIADTAGLRTDSQTSGAIELEGIKRAKAKASESDVVVAIASIERDFNGNCYLNYDHEALEIAAKASASIVILNKVDRGSTLIEDGWSKKECGEKMAEIVKSLSRKDGNSVIVCSISCLEAKQPLPSHSQEIDAGHISNFMDHLVLAFKTLTDLPPDMADLIGVTSRQSQLLSSCSTHLLDFRIEAEKEEVDIVLAAEHLRAAGVCLARITGRGEAGDVEEVLGVVFEKYFLLPSPFETGEVFR